MNSAIKEVYSILTESKGKTKHIMNVLTGVEGALRVARAVRIEYPDADFIMVEQGGICRARLGKPEN